MTYVLNVVVNSIVRHVIVVEEKFGAIVVI